MMYLGVYVHGYPYAYGMCMGMRMRMVCAWICICVWYVHVYAYAYVLVYVSIPNAKQNFHVWAQALWNGCLPALIMVSNPTVQYVIYEWLVARLAEWRRSTAVAGRLPFCTSFCKVHAAQLIDHYAHMAAASVIL